jgi:hypothetical protein
MHSDPLYPLINQSTLLPCIDEFSGDDADVSNSTSEVMTSADYEAAPGGIVINYEIRFVVYTALSVACLLFNALSLAALSHIRGARTVHHRLLTNLAACDIVGSALLWMYYNSPYIFPRYKVSMYELRKWNRPHFICTRARQRVWCHLAMDSLSSAQCRLTYSKRSGTTQSLKNYLFSPDVGGVITLLLSKFTNEGLTGGTISRATSPMRDYFKKE